MRKIFLVALLLWVPALAQPDFSTPEAAYKTYLAACQAGSFEQADLCYTASSREELKANTEFTKNRKTEQLTGTYERLKDRAYTIETVSQNRAILHWQPEDKKTPPLFFRKQKKDEGWRIDLAFMSRYIRQNEDGWSWTFPKAESLWRKGN